MKFILLLVSVFLPAVSHADTYTKVMSCDNSALIVDWDDYGGGRGTFQAVIRDPAVARYFSSQGAGSLNEGGEVIIGGFDRLLSNVFNSPDGRYGYTQMILRDGGLELTVNRSSESGHPGRTTWFFRNCAN